MEPRRLLLEEIRIVQSALCNLEGGDGEGCFGRTTLVPCALGAANNADACHEAVERLKAASGMMDAALASTKAELETTLLALMAQADLLREEGQDGASSSSQPIQGPGERGTVRVVIAEVAEDSGGGGGGGSGGGSRGDSGGGSGGGAGEDEKVGEEEIVDGNEAGFDSFEAEIEQLEETDDEDDGEDVAPVEHAHGIHEAAASGAGAAAGGAGAAADGAGAGAAAGGADFEHSRKVEVQIATEKLLYSTRLPTNETDKTLEVWEHAFPFTLLFALVDRVFSVAAASRGMYGTGPVGPVQATFMIATCLHRFQNFANELQRNVDTHGDSVEQFSFDIAALSCFAINPVLPSSASEAQPVTSGSHLTSDVVYGIIIKKLAGSRDDALSAINHDQHHPLKDNKSLAAFVLRVGTATICIYIGLTVLFLRRLRQHFIYQSKNKSSAGRFKVLDEAAASVKHEYKAYVIFHGLNYFQRHFMELVMGTLCPNQSSPLSGVMLGFNGGGGRDRQVRQLERGATFVRMEGFVFDENSYRIVKVREGKRTSTFDLFPETRISVRLVCDQPLLSELDSRGNVITVLGTPHGAKLRAMWKDRAQEGQVSEVYKVIGLAKVLDIGKMSGVHIDEDGVPVSYISNSRGKGKRRQTATGKGIFSAASFYFSTPLNPYFYKNCNPLKQTGWAWFFLKWPIMMLPGAKELTDIMEGKSAGSSTFRGCTL